MSHEYNHIKTNSLTILGEGEKVITALKLWEMELKYHSDKLTNKTH